MSPPPESAPAQDFQAEAVARDVANDMPSPYCPGRSIASCPSQAARDLEDDILVLAKQGQDRKEIETALVARFGEEKMGATQQSEVLVAILLGAALALMAILVTARRWLRPAPAVAAAPAGVGGAGVGGAGGGRAPTARAQKLTDVGADELDRLEDALDELDEL